MSDSDNEPPTVLLDRVDPTAAEEFDRMIPTREALQLQVVKMQVSKF